MAILLERADQAISVTELGKSASDLFNKLSSGEQDRYVVMKNNSPAAVMMSIREFESVMNELDDLRIDAVARERLAQMDTVQLVPHEEMLKRFSE
jgi:antitoxin StbD